MMVTEYSSDFNSSIFATIFFGAGAMTKVYLSILVQPSD